jgi:arabinan endo-1,5-alpha-L-arabinosidase
MKQNSSHPLRLTIRLFPLLLLAACGTNTSGAVSLPTADATPVVADKPLPDYIESGGLKGALGVHDPVMIKGADTYYVFGTFTGIKTSKDMTTWTNAGAVFPKGFELDWWSKDIPQGAPIWAPHITRHHGKYWMYNPVSARMNIK